MESPLGSDLARLVRVWRALIDHRLKPLELTQTHWVTRITFTSCRLNSRRFSWRKPLVEQPSLVRTLDQLEEKGLISRQTCAKRSAGKTYQAYRKKAEPLINEMEEVIGKTRDEILAGVSKEEVNAA